MYERTPQELGRPRRLLDREPSADVAKTESGRVGAPTDPAEQEGAVEVIRSEKEAKETEDEKSEQAVVPLKAGNRFAGTRWREGH